jgi:type IV pilus assembly protein PilA
MRNRHQNGFTLIELLIVIAIIGILAAVLIPNLLSARVRSFEAAAQSCAKGIATAAEIRIIDTGSYGGLDLAAIQANGGNACVGLAGGTEVGPRVGGLPVEANATTYSLTVADSRGGGTFTFSSANGIVRN